MKELLTRDDKRFLNSVGRGLTSNGYQPTYSIQTEGLAERTGILIRAFRKIKDHSAQKQINELAWAERVLEAEAENKIMRQGDVDIFLCDEIGSKERYIHLSALITIFCAARTIDNTSLSHHEVQVLKTADPKEIYPRMVNKANLIASRQRKN